MADGSSKESAWRKPALSFFLFLAAAVVLAGGYAGWQIYRPEHFFNPINRFQHLRFLECRKQRCPIVGSWYSSMIPEVFAPGEARDQVLRRLAEAGYEENGENHYVLWGADSPVLMVCISDFYVSVAFDETGGLTSARGSGGGVCL